MLPDNVTLKQVIGRPASMAELGIPSVIVTDLIYRLLFSEGEVTVARFVEVIKIHAQLLDEFLTRMKQEHLVEIARTGSLGRLSYAYRLTDEGGERARDAIARSQYMDAAPVDIDSYNRAIQLQTQEWAHVRPADVKRALQHLILPDTFHRRIGPAVNAGTSLFLYGPSGNGKTTIAQAIARLIAGSTPIWLPYAVTVGGHIVKIFDPLYHEPVPQDEFTNAEFGRVDARWGLFQRPAVMVGGELIMEALEVRFEPIAKFYEAPLQLKANGGMFLIDDFGRQQLSPQQLLNRWIVPLENRIDFLRLQSGQVLEYPFRQLIVFSTNLDPGELVDNAFLRRIQMKVEVTAPDERLFYQIFNSACQQYRVPFDKDGFLHLLNKWYREPRRELQAVHPRDILKTLVSICNYESTPPRLTPDLIDEACQSYFVEMHPHTA
ncbi:MAG: ATP-binding protein [Anaerolineales bacterium]|nr:ATP-binding protein [Anaerolineales bacterium]MCB8954376.1 ATP-binding protein [Ardenticatenales bacterium]